MLSSPIATDTLVKNYREYPNKIFKYTCPLPDTKEIQESNYIESLGQKISIM